MTSANSPAHRVGTVLKDVSVELARALEKLGALDAQATADDRARDVLAGNLNELRKLLEATQAELAAARGEVKLAKSEASRITAEAHAAIAEERSQWIAERRAKEAKAKEKADAAFTLLQAAASAQ